MILLLGVIQSALAWPISAHPGGCSGCDALMRALCSCPKRDSSTGCDSKCSCEANLCTSLRRQWMRCSDAGAVCVQTVILLLHVIQSALAKPISAHPGGCSGCDALMRALCSCPNRDSFTGCDSKCSCEANPCTSGGCSGCDALKTRRLLL